jgi:hypothetical protein
MKNELDLARALASKSESDLRMAEIGIEHESERETAYLLKSENMKHRLPRGKESPRRNQP